MDTSPKSIDERNKRTDNQLYEQAVGILITHQKASTSYLQRKLSIGYNKASMLMMRAEEAGVVAAPNHVGKREVLFAIPASI